MEKTALDLKRKNEGLVLSMALLNLAISLITQSFFAYGIFRDELYYLACANRLDFGYVDHPPLSIFILAVWKILFGDSMLVIRIVPALASTASVFMIGLFTMRLGGEKTAIVVSTLTYMLSPIFLGMNTVYSMNTFDFLFWICTAHIFLRLIQTDNKKFWILLGVVLGLGLLNKTSVFWLGSGVFVGTIFTPLRKDLKTGYPYLAALMAVGIFSPYIIWNITHDFAHLEFMRNAAAIKYSGMTPISFMLDQILILNPLSVLIWLPGIIYFFFSKQFKPYRAPGFIWLTTLIILLINIHSKGEYIAASYQILFAGGAVIIEKWYSEPRRGWLKYAWVVPVIALGMVLAPLARPLLGVEKFVEYRSALGLSPPSSEGHRLEELPQFFADMFGWEDLARNVSRVYQSLPDEEKDRIVVFVNNYGKAGAIEYYGKKYPLPEVICPHNSFWYWWPENRNIDAVIITGGYVENHRLSFEEVYEAGFHYSRYTIPYENNLAIFIGKGFKRMLEEIRLSSKVFK